MKMKKFRAKIDTPWCKKGEIYVAHTYAFDRKTFSPKDIPFGYECVDHPEDYPDLFEPVEEKSNFEKWQEALFKPISVFDGVSQPLAQALSRLIGMKLDEEGFCADKIYKEVCGEG